MGAERTLRHRDIEPMHPGVLLAEIVIPATGVSKTEIAGRLGVSRPTLHDLLRRRQGVTPRLALRLGKLFGNGPELWLDLQRAHDLWREERALRSQLASIKKIEAASAFDEVFMPAIGGGGDKLRRHVGTSRLYAAKSKSKASKRGAR
jgi:addiction module HigA family antidote